ncbi:GspE/PulE family protein [Opitutus sp. GAS368]|jgi:type II secretory ATPase GspE/PulE/Tfp pilus assembly ATPase PilB-like protein|uniref:GspE/PulE family protein n=1 Tax=Opitutus sp. GAS368 TaxID=1882749 RepID=UPI000879A327|nr:GspE/PulE family protein [Opitutus sp. GAS368]SDS38625.1 type IV pilus assembly protein PilB [Opitutus sp. GAS368]
MSNVDTFLESLRRLTPAQAKVIDARADLFKADPMRLLKDLMERSVLPKARLSQLWADTLGVAYVNPTSVAIPTDGYEQLPVDIARRVGAVVLSSLGDTVTVAMGDPTNARQVESLGKILGKNISAVFAHPDEIATVVDMYLGAEGNIAANLQSVCDQLPGMIGAREIKTAADVADLVESKAVIELLNSIILTAYRRRASDIHFETRSEDSRVRMRIDGDMQTIMDLPRTVHVTLVVRIKVLCQLDLSQSRMPQDGAFELNFGTLNTAFRVSTLPSLYGEKAVLRVLGSPLDQSMLRLDNLGFPRSTLEAIKRVISRPNGILIVCGPTGSGKTTTLYGCINEVNRPDLNITTIEDPVEYRLPDITQHQVNTGIGLTFSKVLRSIMRQDPDVILIGEIRDLETALIATEAALTGHFVLTTLHTNNALQAVTRLVEIGVDPYLVAPTTMGVLSQRLVRRICSSCKESYQPTGEELAPFFSGYEGVPVTLYRGRGCPKCFGSGFSGRVGIYEFVEVSEKMRELITEKQSVALLIEEAKRVGHRSLRHDGLKKALIGWTTLEEVERSTLPDVGFQPVGD